jgi:hypothetical protein
VVVMLLVILELTCNALLPSSVGEATPGSYGPLAEPVAAVVTANLKLVDCKLRRFKRDLAFSAITACFDAWWCSSCE